MPSIPEKIDVRNLERKKQILLAAAAIALGTAAYSKSRVNGKQLFSASFLEGIQTIFADIVDDGKGLSERLTGKITFGQNKEVLDIEPDHTVDEPPEDMLVIYEEAFVDTDWSKPSETPLQEG